MTEKPKEKHQNVDHSVKDNLHDLHKKVPEFEPLIASSWKPVI